MDFELVASIQTGTSLIVMPLSFVNKIHGYIGAKPFLSGLSIFRCSNAQKLVFKLSEFDFVLEPQDWTIRVQLGYCLSTLQGLTMEKDSVVLGDVFLRKYYSIFDVSNERIGLAQSA